MPDYNLGTAHGKVVIDYHDRGSGKAKSSLDDLESSAKKFGDRAKAAGGTSKEFDSNLGALGGTAAAARNRLAQLAAATLAYRAANMATIPTIKDITAKIAALGRAAKKPASVLGGAGFVLMGRSLAALGGVVSTTVPNILGSLLSLRAVMRGVPQEMKSWPKMIQNIVMMSTVIGGLKKASDWLEKGSGKFGFKYSSDWVTASNVIQKAIAPISQIMEKRLPRAHKLLAESFGDSADAIDAMGRAADKGLSTIAQFAMGIVFVGRTAKAAREVYHGLAWGIERFTWAMGVAGLGSLAFLKVMGGATTLVRGAGDAVKQLSKVVLLLPGALFAVGAALATGMVGFKGFGDALAAVGADQEKFDEATKNLAGSAKDLAVEIRSVRGEWTEFQKGIQEKVFDGLGDRFASLSEKYLPALTEGMGVAADGLNHMFHRLSDFAEQERTVSLLNKGFQDTGRILENTGNALEPFLEGMREIGSVGTRAIADYSAAWEGLGERFSVWAMMNAESGQMRKWMDESIEGFSDLWRLSRNLGSTIANTFRPFFKGDVNNALERAANATERWISYMSPRGNGGQAMQGFVDHLKTMAAPWQEYLPKIMEKFASLLDSLLPVMERFSGIAAKEANTILAILVPALKAALNVIDALGPALSKLIILLSALRTLNWVRKALQWLFSPITNGLAAMAAFRQSLRDVGPAAKDAQKGVVGLAPGVRNLVKGMGEMGKTSAQTSKAAEALNRVRGAFDSMYLRASYGADSVRKSFDTMGERAQAFGRTAAFNLQNAANRFGLAGRAFHESAERTNSSLTRLAGSSSTMRNSVASASAVIAGSKANLEGIARATEEVSKAQEKAAKSNESVAKSGSIVARSMRNMRAAGSGLLDVMGGPWGAAFMAATVVGVDFASMMKRNAEAVKDVATASQEAASAQRALQTAAAKSGGEHNEDTLAASQRMVQAELDMTAATASKADGMFNGLANTIDNLSGVSYSQFAKAADNATNSLDRNRYEGRMAQMEQEALQNALSATGMTMEEAVEAFAKGGPQLNSLQAALRATGDAGIAVMDGMSGVGASISGVFDRVGEMGPRAAALGAAIQEISSAASSAEEKLNALRTILQSMGLMEDSAFDAAQRTADAIRELANVTPGAAQAVDSLGNKFLTTEGKLNPFNAEAGVVQDKLATLRESLLAMDPEEAMAGFTNATPHLAAMQAQLGATDTEWQNIIATMGLTPESINTQIAIQGMNETEQQLWGIQQQIELQDGKTANVTVDVTDEAALQKLQQLGWKVEEWDQKNGTATLTAKDDQAVASLLNISAQIEAFALKKGTASLDADNTPALDAVTQAAGWIGSVDAMLGEGTLGANNDPARGKVQDTDSLIASVYGMFGMGRVDVDNSSVASKVYAAQALIDGLRGRTIYIDVQTRNLGALPSGAGTLGAAAQGATGGRFKGDHFNRLPGHAKGARHKGYQLPRTGPGTDIIDGFLALDHLGAPVARLDKEEWVINGKSSRKWNRLLAAINRDDPRLKHLPAFADGGVQGNIKSQIGKVSSATQVITQQLNIEVNAAQVEAAAAMLGNIASDEFAGKFGRGIADGLNLGSRDYFLSQGKQYSDQLGIVFGRAAQEANDRLQREIDAIEDQNLKEQRRSLLKSTEELQAIADREMQEWVNNNQFEIMGYTMAQSFAQGVSSGQNLLQAGIGALGQAATVALAAAGAPGIVANLAVTALTGLFDAFSDPDLWADGLFEGIYKIIDKMLAGLVTMILDVLRNLFLMIGVDLAKVPFLDGLYKIKDAANGASDAVKDLMKDIEALNKLEYKNLGKTGATTIDAAIEAQLGNRVLAGASGPATAPAPSGPTIGTLNVSAPDDKAASIIEAATFEMKRF